MIIADNTGIKVICRYCDNSAIEEYELCIICALIEGIEI